MLLLCVALKNFEMKIEGEIVLQPGPYQDTLQLQNPGKIWSVLGSDRPNYINPNTDNADCTKANFSKCIRDYLETIAGFPNIGDQMIHWLGTVKKPTLMLVHGFMRR
jgi:hypothetical protein